TAASRCETAATWSVRGCARRLCEGYSLLAVAGAAAVADARHRGVEFVGDRAEQRVEGVAHGAGRADRGNRDQGGDQTVLDGGRAVFLGEELLEDVGHCSLSLAQGVIVRHRQHVLRGLKTG